MTTSILRPRRLRSSVQAAAVAAVLGAALLIAPPAAQAAPADGRSAATAAASCWEIKQNDASAEDGTYWLLTPQLRSPLQVHCDMTTDGGGWVLVGRGRNTWNWDGGAQGTAAQLAGTVTGPAAFDTRKLSSATIEALLGGRRVDSLDDGVRLRRAENTAGTAWQEVRFWMRSRDQWSWAFGAGHPLDRAVVDGASFTGKTTRDFGNTSTWSDRSYQRVWTYESSTNGWTRGFHYGERVSGSTSSSSYVYGGNSYATPFTQVWLRPKLRTADLSYETIPDGGTAAIEAPDVPESRALAQPWGVTGTGAGGTGELATEAQTFAESGGVMYVGGNFTTVRNQSGSESVDQRYLAAFDASTGEWIRSFRPTFDHQVKSLVALPDGRLLVGGDFSTVNGTPRSGLVMLRPDGSIDTSWTTQIENRGRSGLVSVRTMDVADGWVYLGGVFTHTVQGSAVWFQRNISRIALDTGWSTSSWMPNFHGSVASLDVAADGSRVYAAGRMTQSGDTPNETLIETGAIVSTADGAAVVPWDITRSSRSGGYQQAVKEVGGKVWLGGSQHSMFSYDVGSLDLIDTNVTRAGGDFQSIIADGDLVYGSCHCGDWNYAGTDNYDTLSVGSTSIQWDQADKISLIGIWDNATGEYIDEFAPHWRDRSGHGIWAMEMADDGTLWAGGSLEQTQSVAGPAQFSGGFARFAPRPSTAPKPPTQASAALEGGSVQLQWTASPTAGVSYEVLRDDRVVAVTDDTSISVPGTADGRWFVRATDGQGNYSASTPRIEVAALATVLDAGQTWRYHFDDANPLATGWAAPTFDDSAWKSGAAPLGWGDDSIVTTILVDGQTRALASYYRRTVTLASVDPAATYRLTTRADDGIVVYVNGTEVGRANMPDGTVTPNTYAKSAVSTSTAVGAPVTIEIPRSLLKAGANMIAAEVHSNYRSAKNQSFDATVVATR